MAYHDFITQDTLKSAYHMENPSDPPPTEQKRWISFGKKVLIVFVVVILYLGYNYIREFQSLAYMRLNPKTGEGIVIESIWGSFIYC